MSEGYVYFAGPEPLVAIKIGWSKDPVNAVHECGNRWTWFGLSLVAVIPCRDTRLCGGHRYSLERLLHDGLRESHIAREWFNPTSEVLEIIDLANSGITAQAAAEWARERIAA